MDILKKLTGYIGKYRWAVLILLLGIVLMILPTGTDREASVPEQSAVAPVDMEQELSSILAQIHGVGKVQVLLTVDTGAQTVYKTDGEDTVIITGQDRQQSGLVQWVESATYRGAVIVCQGADSPTVRLSIVEAVSRATGLGADRITVLKMK